ncbi:hypothetical protein H4S07_002914, partial [Coemansia furcata]
MSGEDFNFSGISGNRDDGLDDLIKRTLHRNCDAVLNLATHNTSDLRTEAANLSSMIAADLEARMSRAARNNKRSNNSRGKKNDDGPLDAWTTGILEWAGHRYLSSRAGSRPSNNSEATGLDAGYVAPCYEAFLLFVAHYVREYFTKPNKTGHPNLENFRLILPITNKSLDAEHTDSDFDANSPDFINSTTYVDPANFANVECGMFPIGSIVEMQAAPAPHLVVADAEIVRHKDDYSEAEIKLARKTKALFFNQHNRRFAWGGRRAFISLLVDWSLCSVERLGFDPTIRYEIGHTSGDPYLAIDFVEMDETTDKIVSRTYYSQQCVGAAGRLTGRHDRYFTASASLGTLDKPTFLIKDAWTVSGSDSVGDDRESSFLNVLHAEFDKSSEIGDKFSRL